MSEKGRGLGYMNIGGKLRPFHVDSIRQSKSFCEVRGVERDDFWKEVSKLSENGVFTSAEITVAFIYSALFAGAERKRQVIDFTYDDVLDWFEDAEDTEAEEFIKPLVLYGEIMKQKSEALKKVQGQQA